MSTLTIPNDFSNGQTSSATAVNENFTAVETVVNGQLSDDNFSSSSGVYSAYRTIAIGGAILQSQQAAGTYFLVNAGQAPLASAADFAAGASTVTPASFVYLDDADFTISGRTTRLRVRAQVSSNGTGSGITFTFGLYPVTFSGAADVLTATLGTVVSGSTVAIASPAANNTVAGTSTDVSVPSDGLYALGVVTSGTQALNAAALMTARLQQRWT